MSSLSRDTIIFFSLFLLIIPLIIFIWCLFQCFYIERSSTKKENKLVQLNSEMEREKYIIRRSKRKLSNKIKKFMKNSIKIKSPSLMPSHVSFCSSDNYNLNLNSSKHLTAPLVGAGGPGGAGASASASSSAKKFKIIGSKTKLDRKFSKKKL